MSRTVKGGHSCRTYINAKPKGLDIQLWRTASPNPLIIKCYLKKRKTFDTKNLSGIKKGGVDVHKQEITGPGLFYKATLKTDLVD